MTTFLIISLLVCVFAGLYILRPFNTLSHSNTRLAWLEPWLWIVIIIALGMSLYIKVGNLKALERQTLTSDSIAGPLKSTREHPASLQAWNELGRAYLLEQNYVHAYMAYTQAEQLDTNISSDDLGERFKWISGLAEARILARQGAVDSTSDALIERAIGLRPYNPKALWYGGLAAAQAGDFATAKLRWERLLTHAQNPPEALKNIVQIRLDGLWQVKLQIQLDAELQEKSTAESRVFISLRQPEEQPPLAAKRLALKDLNQVVTVDIGDTIRGMGADRAINWDEPVSLELTWSPTGLAIAEGNIGFSSPLTRDNLDQVRSFRISALGVERQ